MLDLIVYGATGFTGRLVAQALLARPGAGGRRRPVRWAMAGRSPAKLAQVRDAIGAPASLRLISADAGDAQALRAMARQAKVVLSTVGPYQLHGEPLLAACVDAGTDYVDLCGEPVWMAQMIQRHDRAAYDSGARIVFSCGFDSVPFDLGVCFLQHAALQRFGAPLRQVQGQVVLMKGGFSGGTAASLVATLEAMGRDRQAARTMADPFALTPGFAGPPQPAQAGARYEPDAQAWSAPFVMAPINTKNVHRTHALLGHPWGTDFSYEERQIMGRGSVGELRARSAAAVAALQDAALGFGPTRSLIRRFLLPRPGTGPSRHARETGRYVLRFVGRTAAGQALSAIVEGDRDPGYGSTSKVVGECALCLALDTPRSTTAGGIWTPGAAMGLALLPHLRARAGLSFRLDD